LTQRTSVKGKEKIMAVDKVDKYTGEVSNGVEAVPQREVQTKRRTRLSTKVFSLIMLGSMTIILVDGFKNASNDPAWAMICVLMGIPVYSFGLFELFRMK
jgi:hypothetical protein